MPYVVMVNPPLGFISAEPMIEIDVTGPDHEVIFELDDATSDKVTDLWWWKNQIQAIHDGETLFNGLTLEDIENYCQAVFDHFYDRGDPYAIQIEGVTYVGSPTEPLGYEDVYDLFLGPCDESNAGKTKKHLLVTMLNVASGRLSQMKTVSDDGATVSQAITYFSGLYLAGGDIDWTVWYNLMRIQFGWMIPSGVIPPETPNVMFKPEGTPDLLPKEFTLWQKPTQSV